MRSLMLCLGWLLPALLSAPALAAEAAPPQTRVVADSPSAARVIVKYRDRAAALAAAPAARPQRAAALGARMGLALRDGPVLGPRTQGLRARGLGSEELARRLRLQPDVEWVVPDRRRYVASVPNDPYYGPGQTSITPAVGQWYLRAPDNGFVGAIDAAAAWALSTGSASITVAVLDTGVRLEHPDLFGKLHPGYDFVGEDEPGVFTTAADGDGRDPDPSDPGDWTAALSECGAGDSSWHGTRVAGLIGAASDNGIGIAGTARNVMLLPVRVLGKCGGYDSDIIAGMRWAAGLSSDPVVNAHPAKVLNMSLGSRGRCEQAYSDVFDDLLRAGVTVVASAGNNSGTAVSTPANCVGAIAVAGLRHAGTKVGYSSVGPEVAIAAPAGNCVNLEGECLYPLLTLTNLGDREPTADGYATADRPSYGTSFSAPLVAGTAALMLSIDPTLGAAEIRAALQASARPFPGSGSGDEVQACRAPDGTEQLECYCTTRTCGAGMLDAAAAVAAATGSTVPPISIIVAQTTTPAATQTITLSATSSRVSADTFQWQIVDGGGLAALVGATTNDTVRLQASLPGSVTVRLAVFDRDGASDTSTLQLNVQPAPAPDPDPPPSSGGGGGGAVSAAWLAGLALAVAALRLGSCRARRTPSSPEA